MKRFTYQIASVLLLFGVLAPAVHGQEPQPQTISFGDPIDIVYGDPPVSLDGYATASSGLPISEYRVLSGSANVVGGDLVVWGTGVVVLRASQEGDSEWLPAAELTSFVVGGAAPAPGPAFLDLWTWRYPPTEGRPGYNGFAEGGGVIVAVGDGGRIATSSDGITWATAAELGGVDLYDVAYDGVRFIAVGSGGALFTSTDGTNWSAGSSGTNEDLYGVTSNNALGYAAVGANGTILHSTDGTNWSAQDAPGGIMAPLFAVASLGAPSPRFIAVGARGTIATSTNGTDWNLRQFGLSFALEGVHVPADPNGEWRAFAVGENGVVMASQNGMEWSTRHSQSSYNLQAAGSGNGFLLAVGDDGRVLVSRDGDSWTEALTRFPADLRTVIYSAGLFHAGGDNHSIMASPDGLSWTLRETQSRIAFHDTAGGNGVWVAVGDSGSVVRTTDRNAPWSPAADVPSNADLMGVVFGDGDFVAVGSGGAILRSADGDTWTHTTAPVAVDLLSIDYANGRYVAVGESFTILTSPDGASWTLATAGSTALRDVAYNSGDDVWVVVGDGGTLLNSNDGGDTWQFAADAAGTQADLLGVTFGDERFVAVGRDGTILSSSFGHSWSSRLAGTEADLYSVALADGVFVVVGEMFTFVTSRDGVDWTAQSSGTRNNLRGISYAEGLLATAGDFESVLTAESVLSPGLDRWTLRNPIPEGPELHDVIYANNAYVAVGDGGAILVSTDGQSWQERDSTIDDPITGIAYGNGRFVAVGGQNILVSEDSQTWRVQRTWLVPLREIAFGRNTFVAVGESSHILHSEDGITWAGGQQAADGQVINDVSYSEALGQFVAVGAPSERTMNLDFMGIVFSYPDTPVSQLYTSSNGIEWMRHDPPLVVTPTRLVGNNPDPDPEPVWLSRRLNTVTYGNDRFYAAGEGIEMISVDGVEWIITVMGGVTIHDVVHGEGRGDTRFVFVGENGAIFSRDPDSISFPGITERLNSVAWARDEFIAVGENARILTSPNGQFWQTRSSVVLDAFHAVASRPGRQVVVGAGGRAFYSDDAIEWTEAATGTVLDLNAVAWTGSRFVATGNSGTVVTSASGDGWTARFAPTHENLHDVAAGGGVVVAVGTNGTILSAPTGESWTTRTSGIAHDLYGVHFSPAHGAYFAVGGNATVLRSSDGIDWEIAAELGGLPLYGVGEHVDGVLIAVGEAGIVYNSLDGETWTRRFSGTSNALFNVSFGDGILFATGANGVALSSSDGGSTWFRRHTNTGYALHDVNYRDGFFTAVGGFSTIITSGSVESKFDQTIQFLEIEDKVISDPPFVLQAAATSGLPVTFEVESGPAAIDDNILTLTGETGTVVVRASQPGNPNFRPAPDVTRSFNVLVEPQTITFDPLPDRVFGEPSFQIEATASSGLPVTLAVESGPATITGSTVTLTGAGTVTIRATQEGDEEFTRADPVFQTFEVARAAQTITFPAPGPFSLGDPPVELEAAASSGLPVGFRLISGPADLSGNILTLSAEGTVVVEAHQEGDDNYLAADPVTRQIDVTPAKVGEFWDVAESTVVADLRSVVFGNRRFVITGDGQTVLYGGGGTQWTRALSGTHDLPALAYGDGHFLAGGEAGVRIASPDGESWNQLPDTLTEPVRTLAYGGALFVAGGPNGFIATSPDRVEWTERESGVEADIADILYADGRFYAIAGGRIITSATGREWETVFSSSGVTLTGITYGAGRFVVVGAGGAVWASDNGSKWVLGRAPVGASFNAVTYGAGLFVAVGADGLILSSVEGFRWTTRASGVAGSLLDVAYFDDLFVAVGEGGTILVSGALITKEEQQIHLDSIPDREFEKGDLVLSATATSGLTVQLAVASGPAELKPDGRTLRFTGLGEVVVRAAQPGDRNYYAAPELTRTFKVFGPLPAVSLAAPFNGDFVLLGSPVEVEATVTIATGGALREAVFFVDDEPVESRTQGPFTFSFTPDEEREYSLRVRVEDNLGNRVSSATVVVFAVDSSIPEIASFTSTAVARRAFVDEGLVFDVDARDETGIAMVRLYRDGQWIATDENEPYRFAVTHPASGTYSYQAEAINLDGVSIRSEMIEIQVGYPNVAENDTDFVHAIYQDLLRRRPTAGERADAVETVQERSRAVLVEEILISEEFASVKQILRARFFLTGSWGDASLLQQSLREVERENFAIFFDSLMPIYLERKWDGDPLPVQPARIDDFLHIAWHTKYGHAAPAPDESTQLSYLRRVYQHDLLRTFLIQFTHPDGEAGQTVLGVQNPPPDLLSRRAEVASLYIALLRDEPSTGRLDELAAREPVDMIRAILNDPRYLDRFRGPLLNGVEYDHGVSYSSWFGWYNRLYDPWVYHYELGWLYLWAETPESIFIFDFELGWLWTSDNHYYHQSLLYHYASDSWIRYSKGSGWPRRFESMDGSPITR